jgi:DNA-binding transcriptional regulator GbsR (MarR family)
MLDGLGQLADYFGFSKVMGQIYGALLLSSKPMCLDDLVENLDISKANASMNMRTLENMGMVRQVWVRGASGRRKFYEAETDFWQIIINIINGREMRDVDRAIHVMDDNIRQLQDALALMSSEEDREAARLYIERISRMQGLFQFAQFTIAGILGTVARDNVGREGTARPDAPVRADAQPDQERGTARDEEQSA